MNKNESTQAKDFIVALENFISEIEELDKNTEWQPREPYWCGWKCEVWK